MSGLDGQVSGRVRLAVKQQHLGRVATRLLHNFEWHVGGAQSACDAALSEWWNNCRYASAKTREELLEEEFVIVLQHRLLDAFAQPTLAHIPKEMRQAFEAYILADEDVPGAYAYARSVPR